MKRIINVLYELDEVDYSYQGHSLKKFTLIWRYRKMLDKIYLWLFNSHEREPVGFIAMFFIIILVSTVVSLFMLSVSRHLMWI